LHYTKNNVTKITLGGHFMTPMNVSDLSVSDITEIFIFYISNSSESALRQSAMENVVDNETDQRPIGKYRLIHIADNRTDEYLTFAVSFYMDDNAYKMEVFNHEKAALLFQCTFDPNKSAWISEITYPNINLSSIICTEMAVKLKTIL
jgi:hypothetical protein